MLRIDVPHTGLARLTGPRGPGDVTAARSALPRRRAARQHRSARRSDSRWRDGHATGDFRITVHRYRTLFLHNSCTPTAPVAVTGTTTRAAAPEARSSGSPAGPATRDETATKERSCRGRAPGGLVTGSPARRGPSTLACNGMTCTQEFADWFRHYRIVMYSPLQIDEQGQGLGSPFN